MTKQTKAVKSRHLANLLINKGFNVVGIKADKVNTDKSVYIFNHSEELQKVIDAYMATKYKKTS